MAFDDDLPMWLENVGQKFNAREYRRLLQDLCRGQGRIKGLAFAVSAPPAMTCKLTDGSALIEATTGTAQGLYYARNVGDILDIPIAPSDPTNPRWDVGGIWIRDSEHDGGGFDNGPSLPPYQIIEGTPAGSPALPTLPDNFLALTKIVVDAAATTVTVGKFTNLAGLHPRAYEDPTQALTWTAHTVDADLDTWDITAQPDWAASVKNRLTLYINPSDSDLWDVELEVWTGAGGTGTKIGVGAMRNTGANGRRQVTIDCDEFVIAAGATQTFHLRANYSTAVPTTGFVPASLGECKVRPSIRPYPF